MSNLSYESCVELKSKGFPQNYETRGWHWTRMAGEPEPYLAWGKMFSPPNEIEVSCPSLSELIAECGYEFEELGKQRGPERGWYARGFPTSFSTGKMEFGPTPEEAVKNLWIAIKGK